MWLCGASNPTQNPAAEALTFPVGSAAEAGNFRVQVRLWTGFKSNFSEKALSLAMQNRDLNFGGTWIRKCTFV